MRQFGFAGAWVAGVVLVLACAAPAVAEERTFGERLGWGPEDRIVIFNNDDAGMSHGQNLGSIQSYEEGVVSSWTIMMPCSSVTAIRDYLEEHPEVSAGLHITHTSEFGKYRWRPISGPTVTPGLYDGDGYMWPSVAEVVKHATPDEIETELRAQLEMAEKMGIAVTHFDTHMGAMNATPGFYERFVNVAIDKGLPIRVAIQRIGAGSVFDGREAEVRAAAERLWAAGLPVLDYVIATSYGWPPEEKLDRYIALLRELPPGVTEIIVHAAVPTEDFKEITTSGPTRHADLLAMTDPRLKEALEAEGIITVSWRELHERRKQIQE